MQLLFILTTLPASLKVQPSDNYSVRVFLFSANGFRGIVQDYFRSRVFRRQTVRWLNQKRRRGAQVYSHQISDKAVIIPIHTGGSGKAVL